MSASQALQQQSYADMSDGMGGAGASNACLMSSSPSVTPCICAALALSCGFVEAGTSQYLQDAYDGAMQTPDLNERPREDDVHYGTQDEVPYSMRQQLPAEVAMEHVSLSLQPNHAEPAATTLLPPELQPPLPVSQHSFHATGH